MCCALKDAPISITKTDYFFFLIIVRKSTLSKQIGEMGEENRTHGYLMALVQSEMERSGQVSRAAGKGGKEGAAGDAERASSLHS